MLDRGAGAVTVHTYVYLPTVKVNLSHLIFSSTLFLLFFFFSTAHLPPRFLSLPDASIPTAQASSFACRRLPHGDALHLLQCLHERESRP